MMNKFFRINLILLIALNSMKVLAAEDFDCYSEDNSIVFAGKTMERDGAERLISGLNVWVNGKRVARILNEDFGPGEHPYKFSYVKEGLNIKFDWEESRSVVVKYHGDENGVGAYKFAGKLICS